MTTQTQAKRPFYDQAEALESLSNLPLPVAMKNLMEVLEKNTGGPVDAGWVHHFAMVVQGVLREGGHLEPEIDGIRGCVFILERLNCYLELNVPIAERLLAIYQMMTEPAGLPFHNGTCPAGSEGGAQVVPFKTPEPWWHLEIKRAFAEYCKKK
jgi:hypothetical protein